VILRDIVRDIARQFSLRARFSPILAPGAVGSGVHLHFSLLDKSGKSLMADAKRPGGISARAGSFAAGILRHTPALCALTAPTVISYMRLNPHRWSAGFNCFGYRNREAAVRICPVDDTPGKETTAQTHLEFRAADAAASPYIVLGALIRAGIEGLRGNLATPPLVEGDPADLLEAELTKMNIRRLPGSLTDALDKLHGDAVVKSWLPKPLQDGYFAMKQAEIEKTAALDPKEQCDLYGDVY
jgi:glutamine synthetase